MFLTDPFYFSAPPLFHKKKTSLLMHRRIYFPPKDPPKKFLYTPPEKNMYLRTSVFVTHPPFLFPTPSLPPLELALVQACWPEPTPNWMLSLTLMRGLAAARSLARRVNDKALPHFFVSLPSLEYRSPAAAAHGEGRNTHPNYATHLGFFCSCRVRLRFF